jgi:hypothetical protein
MAKVIKPTKQQLAQAKLRAASSGINMDQSAKGLRNAGKAIAVGASLLPIGRGAKAASMVARRAALVAKNKKSAKNNMKIVNKVADLQQKTKAETIAKNSVKVKRPQGEASNKIVNQKEAERLTRNPMPKSTPKTGRGSARPDYEVSRIKISENVTARVPKKSNYSFAKDMSTIGKIQKQNAGPLKATKAEAKINARALKAANKKKK